jgi:hypothetical protein
MGSDGPVHIGGKTMRIGGGLVTLLVIVVILIVLL